MAWDAPGLRDPELGRLPGHLILLLRNRIYIIVGATGSPVRSVAVVQGA